MQENNFDENTKIINQIINDVLKENNLNIPEHTTDNLAIHLSLVISRVLNHTYYNTSISQLHNLKQSNQYNVAKEIIKRVSEHYSCSIEKIERYYTVLYLDDRKLLDLDFDFDLDMDDDLLKQVIDESILTINNELNLNLNENSEFFKSLSLHLYPAINRLQNNKQITDNPLVDVQKYVSENAYKAAIILNKHVKKYYKQSFNDDELAYIAIHFGTIFK